MSKRAPLTSAEVGQAIHDYEAGRPVIDIAAELQCNPVTIYNHLHRRGVTVGTYTFKTQSRPKPAPVDPDLIRSVIDIAPEDGTGDWTERGSCRQTDPELFFPTRSALQFSARAKKVCRQCPVTAECLEHALTTGEDYGVWGGLSANERRKLRNQRSA